MSGNTTQQHTTAIPTLLCVQQKKIVSGITKTRRHQILGAFAKLRKTTISFVLSVRLSVLIEQLGSHWKDFNYN
jgi:hypothetical protein